MRTELISRRRGSSRAAALNTPETIVHSPRTPPGEHFVVYCNLCAVLRLGLVAQGVRNAGQHATGKQRHSHACITDLRHPGCSAHASGKLAHHACDTSTRLHADVLGADRKLHHFATEVAGDRLRDAARWRPAILFQLSPPDTPRP